MVQRFLSRSTKLLLHGLLQLCSMSSAKQIKIFALRLIIAVVMYQVRLQRQTVQNAIVFLFSASADHRR